MQKSIGRLARHAGMSELRCGFGVVCFFIFWQNYGRSCNPNGYSALRVDFRQFRSGNAIIEG